MTHQPPVPKANTSPYPLHPEAEPEDRHTTIDAFTAATKSNVRRQRIARPSIRWGAAAGIGVVAAVAGLLYARRRSAATA